MAIEPHNGRIAKLWLFVRLSRPHFLAGGFLMFWLGARTAPHLDIAGYVLGQTMVTSAQITAHYLNEYADRDADVGVTNRTLFSGGSGVLPEGSLDPVVARRAGTVTSLVALATSLAVAVLDPAAAVLGIGALGVSWAYSMPPVRLLATGWGEAATSLVVAAAVPLIGVLSQGATPDVGLWGAIGVLVPIHMAMMLGFELPDLETDRAAGKRVLAVRIGRAATIALIGVLTAGSAIAAMAGGAVWAGVTAATGGLLAAVLAIGRRHRLLTLTSVATFVLSAVGLAASW